MPYSGPDDPKLPSNVRRLSPKRRRQWVHVWNSVHKQTNDEHRAFAAANAAIKKSATRRSRNDSEAAHKRLRIWRTERGRLIQEGENDDE